VRDPTAVGIRARTGRFRGFRAGQRHRQREGGPAAAPLRNGDIAAHRAGELFDRMIIPVPRRQSAMRCDIRLRETDETGV